MPAWSGQRAEKGQDMQKDSIATRGSDNKGRVTSAFALALAVVVIALSVLAVAGPLSGGVGYGRLVTTVVAGLVALVAAHVLMIPAMLLGLRSANLPKGHVGRGRGLFSVIAGVTVPVVAGLALVATSFLQVRSIMDSGALSRLTDPETHRTRLVSPGTSIELDDDLARIMEAAGLMPDNPVDEDGMVPIEASDGSISIGGRRIVPEDLQGVAEITGKGRGLLDKENVASLSRQIEDIEALGVSLAIDSEGHIVAKGIGDYWIEMEVTSDGLRLSPSVDIEAAASQIGKIGEELTQMPAVQRLLEQIFS